MPKIKMLTSLAGLNHSIQFGEEVEVSDEIAKAWVEAGIGKVMVVEEAPKKTPALKKGDE